MEPGVPRQHGSLCADPCNQQCAFCVHVIAYQEYMLSLTTDWPINTDLQQPHLHPKDHKVQPTLTPWTWWKSLLKHFSSFPEIKTVSQEDFFYKPHYQLSQCFMQLVEKHLAASGFVSFLGEGTSPFTELWLIWEWNDGGLPVILKSLLPPDRLEDKVRNELSQEFKDQHYNLLI